jgi:hypothetical protein
MFQNLPFFVRTFPWVLCVLFGVLLLSSSAWRFLRGLQTKNWSYTNGEVLSSKLNEYTDTSRDKDNRTSTTTEYDVEVQYQYQVDGKNYTGSRISYSYARSRIKEHVQEIHEKMKTAKIVRVYYDKTNPQTSVLVTGFDRTLIFFLGFGLLLLALGRLFWLTLNSKPFSYANLIQSQTSL